jgi:hypothetical protein
MASATVAGLEPAGPGLAMASTTPDLAGQSPIANDQLRRGAAAPGR